MSASFPYDSYFLKAVGFASSVQLQPNVFCVGGMCNICTILVLKKFQSSGGAPAPPRPWFYDIANFCSIREAQKNKQMIS